MQGEVYVTVEADASTPNLMAAGSNMGHVNVKKQRVKWETPSGITGISWPSGVNETMNKQEINDKIRKAFNNNRVTPAQIEFWRDCGCIKKIK